MEKTYSICKHCGSIMYRIKGHQHGDGLIDSDKKPVWLQSDHDEIADAGLKVEKLPIADCGCNPNNH